MNNLKKPFDNLDLEQARMMVNYHIKQDDWMTAQLLSDACDEVERLRKILANINNEDLTTLIGMCVEGSDVFDVLTSIKKQCEGE